MSKIKQTKIPSEHQEQVAVVRWCKAKGIIAVAVPNGFHTGKRDNKFFGMIASLKSEGYSPGFPDLIILAKNGEVMFVEMKASKGGCLKDNQKAWQDKLLEFGFYSVVARGADEAISMISEFVE